MDLYDFKAHLIVCLARENMDREFQMRLSGVSAASKNPFSRGRGSTFKQKFNPDSGKFE